MIEIDRVKVGDILITKESRSGQQYLFYGPVVSVERETNEVGIKTTEGNRLFPIAELWTIPAFLAQKTNCGEPATPSPKAKNLSRLLGGYIITLSQGEFSLEILKEVAQAIRNKGIATENVRAQEVIASLR